VESTMEYIFAIIKFKQSSRFLPPHIVKYSLLLTYGIWPFQLSQSPSSCVGSQRFCALTNGNMASGILIRSARGWVSGLKDRLRSCLTKARLSRR